MADKQISDLPLASAILTDDVVELEQSNTGRSVKLPFTKDASDNITTKADVHVPAVNTLFTDVIISETTDSTVTVEGCAFETTGTTTTAKFGDSALFNTLITTTHLQAKRDCFLFIEADTDDVATGDQPIFVITNNANDDMFRIVSVNAQGHTCLDVGSATGTPDMIFSTGGNYLTAPATGTIPNYAGGGKIPPTESFRILGSNQQIKVSSTVYLGSATSDPSAIFQVDSTTQGVLDPRMTTTERNAIASPAEGLRIFNTTTKQWEGYNGTAWVILG